MLTHIGHGVFEEYHFTFCLLFFITTAIKWSLKVKWKCVVINTYIHTYIYVRKFDELNLMCSHIALSNNGIEKGFSTRRENYIILSKLITIPKSGQRLHCCQISLFSETFYTNFILIFLIINYNTLLAE